MKAYHVLLVLTMTTQRLEKSHAFIDCKDSADCERLIIKGTSTCRNGKCTNPYSEGCLRTLSRHNDRDGRMRFSDERYQRTCSSDDHNEDSNCRPSPLDYDEIRIAPGNWESSILFAWILSIILSEVLDVPVTIENGHNDPGGSGSFYYSSGGISYAKESYNFDALEEAYRLDGDCSKSNRPCAHVIPETWNGVIGLIHEAQEKGFAEPEEDSGMIGILGVFIPLFTAQKDWSLTSHYGLQNEQKMAQIFKKPTNWFEYCNLVSSDNCTTPDDFARYYPNKSQELLYYEEDQYRGYFRETERTKCKESEDCGGYFVNVNCTWTTYIDSQLHHNNISLVSDGPLLNGGYRYSEMVQIWNAADETQSDVMFWWYSPDLTYEKFSDSNSSFVRVAFPRPSKECVEYRTESVGKCSSNIDERVGDKIGSCDYEPNPLKKILSSGLRVAHEMSTEAKRSPALEFLERVRLQPFAMEEIFHEWSSKKAAIDPRDVVCEWVYSHIDTFDRYYPQYYPRRIEQTAHYSPSILASIVLGVIALLFTCTAAFLTFYYREHRVMIHAQLAFLKMILFGFFLVPIGAILGAIEPSTFACGAVQWFVLLGHTFQFVPFLVKVSAINQLTTLGVPVRRGRHEHLDPRRYKRFIYTVIAFLFTYLSVWTWLDPFKKVEENSIVNSGSSICIIQKCGSSSDIWFYMAFVWEGSLLISTLVLAVQSRNVRQELNESQSLGLLTYIHFLFFLGRLCLFFFRDTVNSYAGTNGILLSCDNIIKLTAYFGRKYALIRQKKVIFRSARTSMRRGIPAGSLRNVRGSYISGLNVRNQGDLRSLEQNLNESDISAEPSQVLRFPRFEIDNIARSSTGTERIANRGMSTNSCTSGQAALDRNGNRKLLNLDKVLLTTNHVEERIGEQQQNDRTPIGTPP